MTKTRLNQSGMVSIIVSTIIMTILTLIVLSFAAIMQREQRQSLDRQLSSQAFYAAESAVNDVRQQVYASLQPGGTPLTNVDTCDGLSGQSEPVLNADLGTEVSCLTVRTDPVELVYDSVGLNRSTVFTLDAVDNAGNSAEIFDLEFYYDDPEGDVNFKGVAPSFTTKSTWGAGPGVLRLEIVPIPSGAFSRDFLRNNNRVYFAYPNTSGSGIVSWDVVGGTETRVVSSACGSNPNWPRACRVVVDDLPTGYTKYAVKMISIYEPISVTSRANGVASSVLRLVNEQVVVDSTGRANDVISRVREIIPVNAQYDYAEFGLDVGSDVCKLIEANPNGVDVSSGGAGIPACRL